MTQIAPEILWEFALGNLSPTERADIDAELVRSPALRAELSEILELAGALPLALPPIEPSPSVKARLLESISASKPYSPWIEKLARLVDVGVESARKLMDLAYDPKEWGDGGMDGFELIHFQGGPATAGADVGFVRAAPGFRFPQHRHDGDEITLVLQGAYRDSADGVVARAGDWIVRPAGSEHHYVVEPGEPCVYATVLHRGLEVLETGGPGAGWTVGSTKKH